MALIACVPPSWKTHPKVGKPQEGVPIEMYCATQNECSSTRRGVVTARGGDPVDWYALTMPESACHEDVQITVDWEIPRDDSRLAVSFWYPDRVRGLGGHVVKRMNDDAIQGERGRIRITDRIGPGTYMIGVHARGPTGAGEYRLTVREQGDATGCGRWTPTGWQLVGDVIQPRPENLTAPASNLVSITSAGMSRKVGDGVDANEPTVVIDASDPRVVVGARATLVDSRGGIVRHGELAIVDVWSPEGSTARFASARFVTPGWFRRKIELGWNYWFAHID